MLIGQPATVSTTRYTGRSSCTISSSHNRRIARTLWPHNQTVEVITKARRNALDARTLGGIGYRRWAYSASSGRPSGAEPKKGNAVHHVFERRPEQIQRLVLRHEPRQSFDAGEAERG